MQDCHESAAASQNRPPTETTHARVRETSSYSVFRGVALVRIGPPPNCCTTKHAFDILGHLLSFSRPNTRLAWPPSIFPRHNMRLTWPPLPPSPFNSAPYCTSRPRQACNTAQSAKHPANTYPISPPPPPPSLLTVGPTARCSPHCQLRPRPSQKEAVAASAAAAPPSSPRRPSSTTRQRETQPPTPPPPPTVLRPTLAVLPPKRDADAALSASASASVTAKDYAPAVRRPQERAKYLLPVASRSDTRSLVVINATLRVPLRSSPPW